MKLIIQDFEAINILAEKHSVLPENIEIAYSSHKPLLSIPMEALIKEAKNFNYKSDQKIAAIKAIRELASRKGFYIGLYEAKIFVESLA